jgi:lipoate-protein ligase A
MPQEIRLLCTGFHEACYNMGLDESLLETVAAAGIPTLRFYGWNPAAVSLGYFQKLQEVIDSEACLQHGVDIVRRISGGGTVFHQNELTYSVILPLSLTGDSIEGVFEKICGAVMKGLRILGAEPRFKPVNDIYAGDKKISGNAQIRRQNCVLQHGTVLLDTDPELMFTLLRIPPDKQKEELIKSSKERITGLRSVLGRTVTFEETQAALKEGFRRTLDLVYIEGGCSAAEEEKAQLLAREKFAADEFRFRR